MSGENSYVKISGAIGIKILKNSDTNKKIFIFYDDHSNTNYCSFNNLKSKRNLFISELLNSIINKDVGMVLEEPFIDSDSKIKILWENSEHLFLFRKFYTKLMTKCSNEKICKLFPVDVRLSLFEISPDEIIFNVSKQKPEYNIRLNKYFENIHYLFDLNKSTSGINSICVFIKKVFNVCKSSDYYKLLKNKIIDFSNKHNIYSTEDTIYDVISSCVESKSSKFIYEEGYPYNSTQNSDFIDELDKITSAIMELYSVILISLLPNKNIIFFAGYYHSNNISYILQKYYNFKQEYAFGNTDNIEKRKPTEIKNCIKINKKYFNLFQ
jgi:hypothetical protein